MTKGKVSVGETRGRIAATALLVFVLVAVAVASAAPAASAACPNEAFRTGPSAQLPECRAYEQVTPVDKESGVGVYERGGAVYAAPDGNGIYFNSTSAYAGSPSNLYFNPYVASRLDYGWSTAAIGAPQAPEFSLSYIATFAVSPDLGLSFLASKEALAPGAIEGGSNLYLRDNRTATYATVAAVPGNEAFGTWVGSISQEPNPFVDANADWSRILIYSPYGLTPEVGEGHPSLYEYAAGQLHRVVEAEPAGTTELTPNRMSADGSRFFYKEGGIIYQHRLGQAPLIVSEDEEGNPLSGSSFLGATPDGETAFFRTFSALYRFEATAPPGDRVKQLTPFTGLEGEPVSIISAYAGEDGTSAYFVSQNLLTPDAEPLPHAFGNEGYEVYVWHGALGQEGEIRYVGQSDEAKELSGPGSAGVSPNGRFLGFQSFGEVTPDAIDGSAASCPGPYPGQEPGGRCNNVFLYSLDADRTVCVTCAGAPAGDSQLGGAQERPSNIYVPHSVLDDGTIFFDTPNALSPRDANGVLDPYSWRDGVAQLVSTGTSRASSGFVEATPDGSDVFFQTQQPLVGQDADTSIDLYDARVDGGLPQAGPGTASPCSGESNCRGGTDPTSASAPPASGAIGGAGNVRGACVALRSKARAARKRSKALARRAGKADGGRAQTLRKAAARESRTAKRLGRRAGNCGGGGR